MKNRGTGIGWFRLLYLAVLAGFCVTGVLLLRSYLDQTRAQAFYQELTASGQSSEAPVPEARPSGESTPPPASAAPLPEPCGRVTQLRERYPEVVAWIQIPDTKVDYPVVQGTDNQKYLNTLPDGTRSVAGSIFLDSRCTLDGGHLILYGHNMHNQSMFGALRKFLDKDFLEGHPEFSLYTQEKVLHCRIFSVARVDAYSDTYTADLPDSEAVEDFVQREARESLFPLSVTDGAEQVVTLSTCTGRTTRERLVVQAAVIPED